MRPPRCSCSASPWFLRRLLVAHYWGRPSFGGACARPGRQGGPGSGEATRSKWSFFRILNRAAWRKRLRRAQRQESKAEVLGRVSFLIIKTVSDHGDRRLFSGLTLVLLFRFRLNFGGLVGIHNIILVIRLPRTSGLMEYMRVPWSGPKFDSF